MPYGILGNKAPEKVTVVTLGQKVEFPTNKSQIVFFNLTILFIILTILLTLVILRLKRINPLSLLWGKLTDLKLAIYEKLKKNKDRSQGL